MATRTSTPTPLLNSCNLLAAAISRPHFRSTCPTGPANLPLIVAGRRIETMASCPAGVSLSVKVPHRHWAQRALDIWNRAIDIGSCEQFQLGLASISGEGPCPGGWGQRGNWVAFDKWKFACAAKCKRSNCRQPVKASTPNSTAPSPISSPHPPLPHSFSLCLCHAHSIFSVSTSTTEAAAAATINCHHFLESFHALHFILPPSPTSWFLSLLLLVIPFTHSARLEAQLAVIFCIISTEILCVMHPMFAYHAPRPWPPLQCASGLRLQLPCCLLRCNFRYKRR